MATYSDGHTFCFVCDKGKFPGQKEEGQQATTNTVSREYRELSDRKISLATAKKYGVLSDASTHMYPYFNKDGLPAAAKVRRKDPKTFWWEGEKSQATLFGQIVFPAGSAKAITLVEGECFRGDAEVLTPKGWTRLDGYSTGPVMTGNGRFEEPTHIINKPFEGSLIQWSTRGYKSLTTPDHNMIKITQSGHWAKHHAKEHPGAWNNIPRVVQYGGVGVALSHDQLALCLAMSADSTFDSRKTGPRYVRTSFKKERKIERYRELLKVNNIKFVESRHACGNTFFGHAEPYFSVGRMLPHSWLSLLSTAQRRFVLEELVLWDGNRVTNRNQTEYSSKYYDNAVFVQTLAHLSGFCSTVMHRKNVYGEWYKVSLLHGKSTTSWQSMHKNDVQHKGLVYCLTVPSGSLLVRIDGFISVTGNCDAMAAFEMGGGYPCVSVHSASAAPKNVADNFEYLNAFETIVVCFDKDEPKVRPDGSVFYPGQEAALTVAGMFPLGKVRVLTLAEFKDPNDYLINGKSAAFKKEWWAAPTYTPSGLKLGRDMWEEISVPKNYETVDYPWRGLNAQTYGLRLSELVIVTAETGIGKTSVLKEIEHYVLKHTDKGVGFLHLEEPNSDTALGLMSISADKPLHLPDVREKVDKDELRRYFDDVVANDRVVIWDHFGSNSIHEVLSKIRHMHNLGCKYIILDHLSIVVSDQSGDERKQLDEISTKLKTLCMELNIAVLAVIHQNRQGQIRGTAGVEQLANIVIKLHRDKEDADAWRRNVTKLVIQKNRFCGRTGPACLLWYNDETGRLEELDDEATQRYNAGQGGGNFKDEPW